jgi:hypothetical protein
MSGPFSIKLLKVIINIEVQLTNELVTVVHFNPCLIFANIAKNTLYEKIIYDETCQVLVL